MNNHYRTIVFSALTLIASFGLPVWAEEGQTSRPAGELTYSNPVIAGDWSDPAVIRVGDWYYSTRSSFGFQPGLPLIKSKDLLRWQYIGHVFRTHEAIAAGNTRGGVYGSELGYNPNTQMFLAYTPIDRNDRRVSVYWSKKAAGPYEGPRDVGVPGFDPGFFADDDGRLYLVTNKGVICELTRDGLSVKREVCDVRSGRGSMFEGPDLFKHGDYYYCIYSTGGTRPHQDSVVSTIRARRLEGPWEEDPANPQLKALAESEARFQGPAHGTLIETPDGQWFVTYHAYELAWYSLGRQMCMEPVEWTEDGWWRPQGGRIPSADRGPSLSIDSLADSDEFDGPRLGQQWFFLTAPDYSGKAWSLTERPGFLRIHALPGELGDKSSLVNVFLQRMTRKRFMMTARLEFEPQAEGHAAGIHLFHDPGMNLWLASSIHEGRSCLEVGKYSDGRRHVRWTMPNPFGSTIYLRIKVDEETATFYVSGDGHAYRRLGGDIYFGDSWHDFRDGRKGDPDLGWVGLKKRNVWTAATLGVFAVRGGAKDAVLADFDWLQVASCGD